MAIAIPPAPILWLRPAATDQCCKRCIGNRRQMDDMPLRQFENSVSPVTLAATGPDGRLNN
jgi:hypothetical protein